MVAHHPTLDEWCVAFQRPPEAVVLAVAQVVEGCTAELAVAFYGAWHQRGEVHQLIPEDLLQQRLLPAIQRWMPFLFDPANVRSPSPTVALQRHVGTLHVRAGISHSLVALGFRGFKHRLFELLGHHLTPPALALQAVIYAGEVVDLAQAEMALVQDGAVTAAPRGAASVQPLLEEERQAQLMSLSEEENRFLQAMLSAASEEDVAALGSSPFGLWLNHRAPLLFDEAAHTAALTRIAQTIAHLDTAVLPRLRRGLPESPHADSHHALLREMVTGLEDVRGQVNTLFDRLEGHDGHRDTLTQLFHRGLLPSILRRELELTRRRRTSFSVLLVEVDGLSRVTEDHGSPASDRLLQRVATLLTTQVRASDLAFRHGHAEFLILLVELDGEQSMAVAEKIRCAVQASEVLLPGLPALRVTVSVGVAVCGGQDEPHRITALAAQALDSAIREGRNRVCLALNGVA